MPSSAGMEKTNILTPLQQELLRFLFSDPWFRRYFYLTGGTALSAFYLFHRYSEDLDFFTHQNDMMPVHALIETASSKLGLSFERVQSYPNFARYLIGGELKVDLVTDVGFRVGVPELIEDFMVDSLKNIAVNKVCCLLGRLEVKDYVDLYFLFKNFQFDIFELLTLGQQKDGGLDPFVWASLVVDVKRLSHLPQMIKTVTLKEMQDFFLNLRDQILDQMNPRKKK